MSKRLIMSLLFSGVMTVVTMVCQCGGGAGSGPGSMVAVKVPDGCELQSPKDVQGAMSDGVPLVSIKPGITHFVMECGGRTVEIDKEVGGGDHLISLEDDHSAQ